MTADRHSFWLIAAGVLTAALATAPRAYSQSAPRVEFRVLATNKTSTMEKELNEAAEAGFRFQAVMGGETIVGGNETVVIASRTGRGGARFAYKLLATNRTSTMEKELQEAADVGFEYRGQTIFRTAFGGEEVVCVLERDKEDTNSRSQYKLLATSKTSTLEKELLEAGESGYEVVGMTLAKTLVGGKELVSILKRPRVRP